MSNTKLITSNVIETLILSLPIAILIMLVILSALKTQFISNMINDPIIVYVNTNTDKQGLDNVYNMINKSLQKNSATADITYISKQQGLQKIDQSLLLQADNNIPYTIIIRVKHVTVKTLKSIYKDIKLLPNIDNVQFNINHVLLSEKIKKFLSKIIIAITIFTGISLITILYQLLNFKILQNKQEIEISKLIGASDSFIMLPIVKNMLTQICIASIIGYIFVYNLFQYIIKLAVTMNVATKIFKHFHYNYLNLATLEVILLLLTVIIVVYTVKYHNGWYQDGK